jgi:hypothetical protein
MSAVHGYDGRGGYSRAVLENPQPQIKSSEYRSEALYPPTCVTTFRRTSVALLTMKFSGKIRGAGSWSTHVAGPTLPPTRSARLSWPTLICAPVVDDDHLGRLPARPRNAGEGPAKHVLAVVSGDDDRHRKGSG